MQAKAFYSEIIILLNIRLSIRHTGIPHGTATHYSKYNVCAAEYPTLKNNKILVFLYNKK